MSDHFSSFSPQVQDLLRELHQALTHIPEDRRAPLLHQLIASVHQQAAGPPPRAADDAASERRAMLDFLKRRLNQCMMQVAQLGVTASPILHEEIDNLREQIEQLELRRGDDTAA